ncbi:MAG: chorismate synthase [Candidatus Zixiibacteriota bacterium]|nr:MAG: chorismate synthase [candidate division Zixibacteria bacterium]
MFNYLTAGESHGPQLTAIVEGVPAGLNIDIKKINYQLSRRQKGYGRGGRMKIEADTVEIVSGVRNGVTLGSPITLVIKNDDWENWTKIMDPINPIAENLNLKENKLAYDTQTPRPGHADLSGGIKYNQKDLRNILERASARETAARVAVGSVARIFLEEFEIKFTSHVVQIGEVKLETNFEIKDIEEFNALAEKSEVRCVDTDVAGKMINAIKTAKEKKDSLGGVVEIIVRGLPVGLGSYTQWYKRLEGNLAQVLMSVQSVKSVEIGLGLRASGMYGSSVHDEIFYNKKGDSKKKNFYRKTNNAGGLEGGITTGEDLIIRVGCKPISTLNKPLNSVDVKTKNKTKAMVERTDNCVVPALAVVCEGCIAPVLAKAFTEKFGSDNMDEIKRNFDSFLSSKY